jgi:hypothetical protein
MPSRRLSRSNPADRSPSEHFAVAKPDLKVQYPFSKVGSGGHDHEFAKK